MSEDDRKVYVGGLPFRYTKDDLFEMFEKYGTVDDAFIICNRESGRSKGYGFVVFSEKDSMEDAMSAMNNTELEGRNLIVEKAGTRKSGGGGGGYRRGGGGGGYRDSYSRGRDYGGRRDYGPRGGYGDDRRGYGGGRRDDRY